MGFIFSFVESWSSQDSFWLGLFGSLSFYTLRFWSYPMKDWFYACGMGRCDTAFSDHPFVGLKGELFSFPILVRFHKIKFSIWMYFQSIYSVLRKKWR